MSRLIYSLSYVVLAVSLIIINLSCTVDTGSAISPATKSTASDATQKPTSNSTASGKGSIFFIVVDSEVAKTTYNEIAKQNKAEGFNISGVEYYLTGRKDFGSIVNKLMNQNIETVWVIGSKEDKLSIQSEMKKLGIKTQIGFTQVNQLSSKTSSEQIHRIAFTSTRDGNDAIYVMNADGSNQTRLTYNGGQEPAWSPDGNKIAFTSKADYRWEVYVMNADGSNQTRLTYNGGQEPAWSPDDKKIAFLIYRENRSQIYIMDEDGGNQTGIACSCTRCEDPAWSPGGNKIAFISWPSDKAVIYIMNEDGSNQTQITNNASDNHYPAWSPDGNKIAFVSNRDGSSEIYIMDANGSNQTRVTHNNSVSIDPTWSPDSKSIAFTIYVASKGENQIYVINADGSNQTRLTYKGASNSNPAWSPGSTLQNTGTLSNPATSSPSNPSTTHSTSATNSGSDEETLDQSNAPPWREGWTNIIPVNARQQSFVPKYPVLTAVEVAILTGNTGRGGDSIKLTVLGTNGEVLYANSRLVSEGYEDWLRFTIPEGGINVPTGKSITIRLEDTGKVAFGWKYDGDTYPLGSSSLGSDEDFLFRTYGISHVAPTASALNTNSSISNSLVDYTPAISQKDPGPNPAMKPQYFRANHGFDGGQEKKTDLSTFEGFDAVRTVDDIASFTLKKVPNAIGFTAHPDFEKGYYRYASAILWYTNRSAMNMSWPLYLFDMNEAQKGPGP